MIERIVLLQLKEEASTSEGLSEVAERAREVLPAIPGVLEFHVGLASDARTAASCHIALVLRFESAEDISSYAAPPGHRIFVDEFLRPELESIAAFNFAV